MKSIRLGDGTVPVLGQGTWRMGEQASRRVDEVRAVQLGIDLGMTLIDTAEMYGEGGAEEVVGEAVAGRREQVFLVSKVYPHNAGRHEAVAACERSLRRLGTDYLDLYLLHWRGSVPFAETVEAFEELVGVGKIRGFGASNLDADDIDAFRSTAGGTATAANQVLYNLSRRGIEWDLLPWCRERDLPVMAYSPLEQGRLGGDPVLKKVAARHGALPVQVALAWVLHQPGVVAIPKAANSDHVRENRAAYDLALTPEDMADLDAAFPPPGCKSPLQIL